MNAISNPQTINIETLLPWSEAKEVNTKAGRRNLRKATPDENFWKLWNNADSKAALKSAGISLGKAWKDETKWDAAWWMPISKEQVEKEKANVESSRASDADFNVPAPDGVVFMPFQRAGVKFLNDHNNFLLSDEQGLGKTPQAIGAINCDTSIKKVLIVVPNSLKINWARELARFLNRPMKVEVFDSKHFNPNAEIGIINYESLLKHTFPTDYDMILWDEGQYLQSAKSKRTKASFALKARRKGILTGTPMSNRPANLWPLLHILDPKAWPSFWKYAMKFCDAKNNGFGWDFTGASNIEELNRVIRSTLMCRRLKKDVLKELPPKRRQIIELPSNGSSAAVKAEMDQYNERMALIESLLAKVELAKVGENQEEYAQALDSLKEAQQMMFDQMAKARHDVGIQKLPYAIEHIKNSIEEGGKIVVFAHHLDVIKAIAAEFHGCAVVTGETSNKTYLENGKETRHRMKEADRFQKDPKCLVFIGNDAAGVGLTLTAASQMAIVEMAWTPGNLAQKEDRIHRITQVNPVLIQYLVIEGSVDALMAEKLVWKLNVIDSALDKVFAAKEINEPVVASKSVTVTQQELSSVPEFSAEQKAALKSCLKIVSCMDSDYAAARNDIGLSGCDTKIGHSLAEQAWPLTNKQCVLARKIVIKYWKQLPPDLYKSATGKESKMQD